MSRFPLKALILSFAVASSGAFAQTSPYWIVTKSGYSTVGGTLVSIDADVSVNAFGNVALTGTVTEGALTGSAAVFVPYKQSGSRVSPSISASLNQAFAQINDGDIIVTRQRLSGAPLVTRVMAWKSGTFGATVASSTDGRFDSVTLPSIANDGGVSFTALTGGSTVQGLYSNPDRLRGLDDLVTGLPSGTYRPLIADGGIIVSRTTSAATGAIAVYKDNGTGKFSRTTVSTGFAETGLRPGITDNGSAVSFFGKGAASGTGVYFYDFERPLVERSAVAVAVENSRFLSAPSTAPTIASFSGDNRVAIERVGNLLDEQLRMVFVAKDSISGQDNIFTARIDRATQKVYGLTSIARAGGALGTTVTLPLPAAFNLHDPVNTKGQIVFQTMLSGGDQAVIGFQASQFSKYKQGNGDGNPFNTWWDQPIHPTSSTAGLFKDVGCFETSLAMVSGFYGIEQTPLAMRDYLNTSGRLASNGSLIVDNSLIVAQNSKGYVRVTGRGGNFDSIVTAIRGGDAVMLSVPSSEITSSGTGTNFHAILAYGMDPAKLAGGTVSAADIYVADPGRFGPYAVKYGPRYTQGEELINVTLKDVFDHASEGAFNFDAAEWFNSGTFYTDPGVLKTLATAAAGYTGPAKFADRNMTFFDGVLGVPMSLAPGALVESPLDVVFTDPTTGRRYVSSNTRAHAGDVLLTKTYADMPGQSTESGIFVPEGPEDAFPAYFLDLPTELKGKSLNVDLYGIGNGSYKVSLFTGDANLVASAALTGTVIAGQQISGSFSVTAVPELGTWALWLIGLGCGMAWMGRRAKVLG